jgi:hypothetical protein
MSWDAAAVGAITSNSIKELLTKSQRGGGHGGRGRAP